MDTSAWGDLPGWLGLAFAVASGGTVGGVLTSRARFRFETRVRLVQEIIPAISGFTGANEPSAVILAEIRRRTETPSHVSVDWGDVQRLLPGLILQQWEHLKSNSQYLGLADRALAGHLLSTLPSPLPSSTLLALTVAEQPISEFGSEQVEFWGAFNNWDPEPYSRAVDALRSRHRYLIGGRRWSGFFSRLEGYGRALFNREARSTLDNWFPVP